MKKLIALIALIILNLNVNAQAPVVYIDYVTHNEDVTSWTGASAYYTNNRAKLLTLAPYFQLKGAKWNMQSDYTYLQAHIAKETGTLITSATNSKTVLRWLAEDMGVEMDPHSHENVYIYPDVVKLMDSIGLAESKMVGGNLYAQPNGINTWTALANVNGQNGIIFPSRNWKPKYMMGGGTPMHVADINMYGFWNPQSMSTYTVHDITQPLVHMGVGCPIKIQDGSTVQGIVDSVRTLINNVQSGAYPQSGFYFQSIFFEQGDLNTTAFYNKVVTITDSLSAIVLTGKAQWKTMKQTYTLWETVYNKQKFQWSCGQIASGVEEQSLVDNSLKVFPNPNNGSFIVNLDREIVNGELVLMNLLGQKIYTQHVDYGKNTIELKELPKGLYHCILQEGEQKIASGKIIIE